MISQEEVEYKRIVQKYTSNFLVVRLSMSPAPLFESIISWKGIGHKRWDKRHKPDQINIICRNLQFFDEKMDCLLTGLNNIPPLRLVKMRKIQIYVFL